MLAAGGEAQVRETEGGKGVQWKPAAASRSSDVRTPRSTCEPTCMRGPGVHTHCDSITKFRSLFASVLVTLSPSVSLITDLLAHIVPLLLPRTRLSVSSPAANTEGPGQLRWGERLGYDFPYFFFFISPISKAVPEGARDLLSLSHLILASA